MKYTTEDLNNLRFLLTSSKETLLEWHNVVSEDDTDYAMKLLTNANASMVNDILCWVNLQKEYVFIKDVSDAKQVLSKYMSVSLK